MKHYKIRLNISLLCNISISESIPCYKSFVILLLLNFSQLALQQETTCDSTISYERTILRSLIETLTYAYNEKYIFFPHVTRITLTSYTSSDHCGFPLGMYSFCSIQSTYLH